jgi:hypothetical protein
MRERIGEEEKRSSKEKIRISWCKRRTRRKEERWNRGRRRIKGRIKEEQEEDDGVYERRKEEKDELEQEFFKNDGERQEESGGPGGGAGFEHTDINKNR